MAEKEIKKNCNNCANNDNGVCRFIRENFLIMTRIVNDKGEGNGEDITWKYTAHSSLTITDNARKIFCCNQYKAIKEPKED